MGGAGGTIYNIDNAKRSGAYLATRAINSIAEKYFLDFKEAGYDISENNSKEIAKDLQYHFDSGLIQILNKINESGNVKSNIKSSMIKRLPTTFALSYIKNENNNIDIYNFWAGDSRIYAFGHVDGIHQLTIDDLRNSGDAYDNLTNDSPISNCINADKSYQINTNHIVVNTPVVLFAVTDGAFAYLQTPVHFERVVLETLNDSSNIDNWKRNLEKSFGRNQSDDISLSLTIVGYKNFVELKDSFLVRYKTLLREFEKLDEIVDKLKFQENRANQQNEAIHDVNLNVAECENAIVSANDKSNLLTRTINSLEYEIINSENQIERKKKEIKEIEKTIERKKEEIFHVNNEIGKIENEIDFQKNKLNKFKEKKNNIAGEGVLNELKLLKETNDKLRKELWYKYKEQYERYFINNKNENRTDN